MLFRSYILDHSCELVAFNCIFPVHIDDHKRIRKILNIDFNDILLELAFITGIFSLHRQWKQPLMAFLFQIID